MPFKARKDLPNKFCSQKCSNHGIWNPAYKDGVSKNLTEKMRRQRAKWPEKFKARDILKGAVRRGRIKRQPCEKCGEPDAHAHHEDYSKPLNVKWLCRKHHNEAHFPKHESITT